MQTNTYFKHFSWPTAPKGPISGYTVRCNFFESLADPNSIFKKRVARPVSRPGPNRFIGQGREFFKANFSFPGNSRRLRRGRRLGGTYFRGPPASDPG